LLTLIVVPIVYSLLDPVNNFFRRLLSRKTADAG
jgi:hypothetical protein